MDGDLDLDVLGAGLLNNRITLWINEGGDPIQWTEQTVSNNFNGAHMVRVSDIDNDGDPDILGAAYMAQLIAWWRNDGGDPIVWTRLRVVRYFYGCVTAVPADIDGDEDIDVIGAAQDGDEISLWRNDGGDPVTWTKQEINSNFNGVWPADAADLNGDGTIDVLAGGFDADEIRWWENEPPTGLDDHPGESMPLPLAGDLSQNYPNPFNPITTIDFSLEKDAIARLAVYDLTGRLVTELISEPLRAGSHSVNWNGTDQNGVSVGSGVYFYKLSAGDHTETRRMILLK
jgi:hypothetical protein